MFYDVQSMNGNKKGHLLFIENTNNYNQRSHFTRFDEFLLTII